MAACRVMVVTEDPSLRNILVALLEEWHFQVFPAADGLDALRQIYNVLPQVVVSDEELSNCAGFELLPFLRRRFPEMGVIALTREKVAVKEHPNLIIADEIVPIDPLNPGLLGKSLIRVGANYPFRQECEVKDSGSSPSSQSASNPKVRLAPSAKTALTMT